MIHGREGQLFQAARAVVAEAQPPNILSIAKVGNGWITLVGHTSRPNENEIETHPTLDKALLRALKTFEGRTPQGRKHKYGRITVFRTDTRGKGGPAR